MFRRRLILSTLISLILAGGSLCAQVVRLPAVAPPEAGYPGQLVSNPETVQIPVPPPQAAPAQPQASLPPGARDGIFQKITFDATWLAPGVNPEDFGETQLEGTILLGFPAPTRDSPLLITPGFAVHYLDGPQGRDLPPRLFDAYTQFRWYRELTPQWAATLSVTPGVYSDFEQRTDEAFRLTGSGAAIWTWTPTLKVAFGVAYLDREDIGVLPVGGVIWTPNEDVKFELVAPRPRIARRIRWPGANVEGAEDWAYVAGELGGGVWAFHRRDGRNDVVNIRDYRFILGMERKAPGRLNTRIELAYVFGRHVEFQSDAPEFDPADTVMLRIGASY